jgi:hypothetical protein
MYIKVVNSENQDDEESSTQRKSIKQEEARERKEGRKRKRKENANESETQCQKCVQEGVYDGKNNPHSSRRSSSCPYHLLSKKEVLEGHFGGQVRLYTRRSGLEASLSPSLTQEARSQLVERFSQYVDFFREVKVKSHLFCHYYIIKTLEDEAVQEMPSIVFMPEFFRAAQMLVCSRPITNTNQKLPKETMEETFEEFKDRFGNSCLVNVGDKQIIYGHGQSSLAAQSATVFSTYIALQFKNKLMNYIRLKLSKVSSNFIT